jgi:pyrroline-5-carboxylate reductase
MRIVIIGQGTLGIAIANGLKTNARVRAIAGTTRATSATNARLVADSDVVLLCVKPHDVPAALAGIVATLRADHVLISAAAAVQTNTIRAHAPIGRIVRVMPNTPALVGAAMTVLAQNPDTCSRALATANGLFAHLGRTLVMEEAKMDAVTAISGCGPAFAFVMMDALIDASIALGIPYDHARELVAQTMLGSAKLLLSGNQHPAELKVDVATPSGKTIKGLIELERHGVRNALISAALASAG